MQLNFRLKTYKQSWKSRESRTVDVDYTNIGSSVCHRLMTLPVCSKSHSGRLKENMWNHWEGFHDSSLVLLTEEDRGRVA